MARHKRIKAIADKVITKGLILGFYTPLALYIYASVIYDSNLTNAFDKPLT